MCKKICVLMAFVLVLPLSSCVAGTSNDQGFEGVISFGGEIYPIEDKIGGGALRKGSPYSGDVIPLKDGKLLLVAGNWRGGRTDFEHYSGAGTYGITSDDMGKTWSDPFPLKVKGGGYVNGAIISLFRLKSGAIGLIAFDMFYRSEDEGKTWSKAVPTGPRVWNVHVRNGTVEVLKSGRIVAPAYLYPELVKYKDIKHHEDFSFGIARYSDDEGRTWHDSKNALMIQLEGGRKGFQMWDEWNLVELKDGKLLGFGRTILGRLFQCYSDDQGETWRDMQPTQLASSNTPCIVRRIPSTGDLLIVWSQHSAEEVENMLIRHRLSCAISKDDGKTWEHFKNLESLDDVAKIKPPEIKLYSEMYQKYDSYRQPDDLKRYHKAPGPLRIGYPTLCFLNDKAVITYGYGCKDDTVGYVACKIKVLPTEWFYK